MLTIYIIFKDTFNDTIVEHKERELVIQSIVDDFENICLCERKLKNRNCQVECVITPANTIEVTLTELPLSFLDVYIAKKNQYYEDNKLHGNIPICVLRQV